MSDIIHFHVGTQLLQGDTTSYSYHWTYLCRMRDDTCNVII